MTVEHDELPTWRLLAEEARRRLVFVEGHIDAGRYLIAADRADNVAKLLRLAESERIVAAASGGG